MIAFSTSYISIRNFFKRLFETTNAEDIDGNRKLTTNPQTSKSTPTMQILNRKEKKERERKTFKKEKRD